MTRRPPSKAYELLDRMALMGVRRLAAERPELEQASYQTLRAVLHAEWAAFCGGDRVRVWGGRTPAPEREAKRQRIMAAIKAGEVPAVIARRENVSADWVRKLRMRLIGPDKSRPVLG